MSAASKRKAVEDYALEEEMEILLADGFDEAIVGLGTRFEDRGYAHFVIYDREKIVQVLMKRDGMDRETAEEFFDFNIGGAYQGIGTPAFVDILG